MSVELHIRTRQGLRPDPERDPVLALFYYIHNDWPLPDGRTDNDTRGVIAIDLTNHSTQSTPTKGLSPAKKITAKLTKESPQKYKGSPQKYKGSPQKSKGSPQKYKESPQKYKGSPQKYKGSPLHNILSDVLKEVTLESEEVADSTDTDTTRHYLEHCGLPTGTGLKVTYVNTEVELYNELIQLVRGFDPDILLGYEIQKGSWGYLNARSRFLGVNLIGQIGRVPMAATKHSSSGSEIHVQGRVVLNVWRTLKHEVMIIFSETCL